MHMLCQTITEFDRVITVGHKAATELQNRKNLSYVCYSYIKQ